jgi:hypothetical protein
MHSVNTYYVECSFLNWPSHLRRDKNFCHMYLLLYDDGLEWLRGNLFAQTRPSKVRLFGLLDMTNGKANGYERVIARGEGLVRHREAIVQSPCSRPRHRR